MEVNEAPVETVDEAIVEAPAEPVVEAPAEPETPAEPKTTRQALEDAFAATEEAAEPPAPQEDRARGPDGKFVAKEPAPETEEVEEVQEPEAAPEVETPKFEAPARFSPDAKAAWKDAPVAVQAEINRAVEEMTKGLGQKDAQLEQVKDVFEFAASANVSPKDLINSYLQTEQLLHQNPAAAIQQIAARFGQTAEQYLARVTGGQMPQATHESQQMVHMAQQVQRLEQQIQQMGGSVQQQQQAQVEARIQEFASANPRFEELSGEMTRLIETGYAADLAEAYQIADRLKPALQIETPAPKPAPAQTAPPRALTGSPTGGSTPQSTAPSKTTREALERAMALTASL